MKEKLYCAVYRTGGLDNFKWNRSLAMTHQQAMDSVEVLRTGGRAAYLVDYHQSVAIGLPETYAANDRYYQVDNPPYYPEPLNYLDGGGENGG